jgi:hypothetical protein
MPLHPEEGGAQPITRPCRAFSNCPLHAQQPRIDDAGPLSISTRRARSLGSTTHGECLVRHADAFGGAFFGPWLLRPANTYYTKDGMPFFSPWVCVAWATSLLSRTSLLCSLAGHHPEFVPSLSHRCPLCRMVRVSTGLALVQTQTDRAGRAGFPGRLVLDLAGGPQSPSVIILVATVPACARLPGTLNARPCRRPSSNLPRLLFAGGRRPAACLSHPSSAYNPASYHTSSLGRVRPGRASTDRWGQRNLPGIAPLVSDPSPRRIIWLGATCLGLTCQLPPT